MSVCDRCFGDTMGCTCKQDKQIAELQARVKELEELAKEAHQIILYSSSKDMNIQDKAVKWLRRSRDIVSDNPTGGDK